MPGRRKPSEHDGILNHYRSYWGSDRVDEVHWTPGPVAARLPDLHIVKIAPERPRGMWTFATIGAWRATARERHGLEFMAVARSESASVLAHLTMTAFYHAGPPENRLGAGHMVSIAEGWVDGSPLTVILLSRPYLWGPSLGHCALPRFHVQVLWLIPISEVERAFARRHSVDALEERFKATSIDYLDPFRASVVPEGGA